MNKIGIMGGSFDPIHIGHMNIAEEAAARLGLDEVLFIPANKSYNKDPNENMSSDKRLYLTELAVEDDPLFKASDIEIKRGGTT